MIAPRRVLFLVTEDWYFLSHRLPMARAARDAGFEVHVATRVVDGAHRIRAEGFRLHPLAWSRGSVSPLGNAMAVRALRMLIKRVDPDILHNVAMKPALLGSLATLGRSRPQVVNSMAGLGSIFLAEGLIKRAAKTVFAGTLRRLFNRPQSHVVVQNPDDAATFQGIGVRDTQISRIPGSGVDTDRLRPTPEPPVSDDDPVTATFVGRMLEDKGIRALVAAHRLLRERGVSPLPNLQLAGTPDPENPTSVPETELRDWATEPGITWLGHVSDIAGLWAETHIAVLPSRREGLPKSLLEAAACGRAMVASDAPGCREIAISGETALTHAVDDAEEIADALATLATDAEMRARFGARARALVEERFSATAIGAQTVALYEHVLAPPSQHPTSPKA